MKKAFKIIGIIVILLVTLMSGTALYFSHQIQPLLVSEINKSLAVEVNVTDISLSSLSSFPKLGLTLKEVKIAESKTHFNDYLLVAEELNLFVDIWKIYRGEYVVDAIEIKSGKLSIADLEKGTNYDILTPSEDNSESEVSFEIKSLQIIDCTLQYEHKPSNFRTACYVPRSTIGLKYQEDIVFLGIDARMDKTSIVYSLDTFVSSKDITILSKVEINTEKQLVTVSPSKLVIEEVNLGLEGNISYSDQSYVNISFGNQKASAQSIISILPSNISDILNGITLTGDVELQGYFKGKTYNNNPMSFGFDYKTQNLNLRLDAEHIALEDITAEGNLEIPDLDDLSKSQAEFTIQSTTKNTGSIFGRFGLTNFNRPAISWDGETDLSVKFLNGLSGNDQVQLNSGRLVTKGILKLTYIPNEAALAYNSFKFTGTADLNEISGAIPNENIELKSLNVSLEAIMDDLIIKNTEFEYNNTTGSLTGKLLNYRSLFNKYPNVTLAGTMHVDGLNVSELLSENSDSQSSSSPATDISPIKLDLETNLTNFSYRDFKAKKLSGNLLCDRIELQIPTCRITALEGNTIASIKLKKWADNYLLDINAQLEEINISEMFRQFNNFEQSEITDKHLSGKLSGDILAKVILDRNYNPILPKLYAKANVRVENGALIDYEPLQELSTFVNIDDLRNVKFKTLENEIEIFDQTIFIPSMNIQNNALNLEIEGTHTFENYMRYNMGLSVAELLATKAKWIAKKNEKRIEKNGSGGLTAYIIMEGTPDDLAIKYDRATVKENVKQEVKKEKVKFINALKGEGSLDQDEAKNKDYDDVWDE